MKKYTNLLFDADNTLFDFDAAEECALRETLAVFPLGFSDDVRKRYHEINDREWKRLEKGETTREKLRVERFEKLYNEFGLNGAAYGEKTADVYVEKLGMQHILLPGALDIVKKLSQDYGIYIVTNGITTVQKSRLGASPLNDFVKKCFISQEMGTAKPQKDYFDKVIEAIGCFAADCLVIGDSLSSDIAGAAAAGIDSVWFNPRRAENNGTSPTYIINSLDELYSLL